jgi:hypothetical protein
MMLNYGEMHDVVEVGRDSEGIIHLIAIKNELKYNWDLDDAQIDQVLDDMYEHCLLPCKVMHLNK